MKYLPYDDTRNISNVIVDGSGNSSTRITLSHWPHSGTPWPLKDDLSAQIAFRYLDAPSFHVEAEVVSNNHFDEDGLISIFVMTDSQFAQAHRDLLIDVASAGDFGTFQSPEAARIAFVIAAFADSESSPLPSEIFDRPYPQKTALLYQQILTRLPEIITDTQKYRELYENSEAELQQSEAEIRSGKIQIEEIPAIDLAIVRVPDRLPHPMALHNATGCFRLLIIQGQKYEFRYRYETWVQYISKQPIPRVDLKPLAERFSNEDQTSWEFDGVEEITPRLYPAAEESVLEDAKITTDIRDFLGSAPPAWDPFDPL